jgi:hypothetical protein
MKKAIYIFSFLSIFLMFSLVAWSCASSDVTAVLGQEFTLPVGKTASIEDESLSIKFVEVISDSRCPEGVECIWEGEAECHLRVSVAGSPADMVIVQPGGGADAKDYFIQYKFVFRLEPYPQEGQQIAPSEYTLIMTVTKQS